MRKLLSLLFISILSLGLAAPDKPPGVDLVQTASQGDAQAVAVAWVNRMVALKGQWAGVTDPQVQPCQEFWRGARLLGYFCPVQPLGYVIVSLYKMLEPVKVYSDESNLNPDAETGWTDLVKFKMESIQLALESQVGPLPAVPLQQARALLEIDYSDAWTDLTSAGNPLGPSDYQESSWLLESSWHQDPPYNNLAPMGDGGRTLVGCVATAASQIMRYWAWPPFGVASSSYTWDGDDSCGANPPVGGGNRPATYSDVYDWAHISSRYVLSATNPTVYEDENGVPLTQAHLDAVAELNYEAGVAVEMDYGVCVSLATTSDYIDAYENIFRFSNTVVKRDRSAYTAVDWFNRMKTQFNDNRPIHYRVEGHSLVADGWEETGSPIVRRYHMNYGWDDANNAWWTLDALLWGGVDVEYMLEGIVPTNSLGATPSGTYTPQSPFNYRYFDQDATISSANFTGPQNLQFLHNIVVSAATIGGSVTFWNADVNPLNLFTRGDIDRAIRIFTDGALILTNGGGIIFH